jgi:hypothetical protein
MRASMSPLQGFEHRAARVALIVDRDVQEFESASERQRFCSQFQT